MLAAPFVVGIAHGGLAPAHGPLLVAWVTGYVCFALTGLWLRSRRATRYGLPVAVWGTVCLAAVAVLLVLRPDALLWAPVFLPLAVVSLEFSRRRRDRALANDVVTIVAACLMTLVAAGAGRASSPASALHDPTLLGVTLALVLYFVGTSLYVKTLIRERRSTTYRRASIGYHAGATLIWTVAPLLVPGWVPPQARVALIVFFVVATVRAGVMAGRTVRPMNVGLGELAMSAALTLVLCLLW